MEQPTSLRQAIMECSGETMDIVAGKVTKGNPLKVTLTNNSKAIITGDALIVPKHVTGLSKGKELWLLPLRNGQKYFVLGLK